MNSHGISLPSKTNGPFIAEYNSFFSNALLITGLIGVCKGQKNHTGNTAADQFETTKLADQYPGMVEDMKDQMRTWQENVLKSLTGADYK